MMPESCAHGALYSTAKMDDFAQNAGFESGIAKEGFPFDARSKPCSKTRCGAATA
jgi:hypothetical protein